MFPIITHKALQTLLRGAVVGGSCGSGGRHPWGRHRRGGAVPSAPDGV